MSLVSALQCSPAVITVSLRIKGALFTLHYIPGLTTPSLATGYFNAYGNAARKDEHDYVIHLGDYLYETGKGGERATAPATTIFTLHDYRTRHGLVSRGRTTSG